MVVDAGTRLVPIEVKTSATPSPAMAASIRTFQKDLEDKSFLSFNGMNTGQRGLN